MLQLKKRQFLKILTLSNAIPVFKNLDPSKKGFWLVSDLLLISKIFICGIPVGPFVYQLSITFICRTEGLTSTSKVWFQILIQIRIWNFVSKSEFKLEFKSLFQNSYLNSNLRLGFQIVFQIQIWSFVSKFLVEFEASFRFFIQVRIRTKFRIWN